MSEARRACDAWFMAQPETSGRSGSDSPDVGRLTYEQARDELVDVVRRLHPDAPGPYSWWSWRGQAFDNDAGWRIDYHLATPKLARQARTAGTDKESSYDARISDHAPVVVDYDLSGLG